MLDIFSKENSDKEGRNPCTLVKGKQKPLWRKSRGHLSSQHSRSVFTSDNVYLENICKQLILRCASQETWCVNELFWSQPNNRLSLSTKRITWEATRGYWIPRENSLRYSEHFKRINSNKFRLWSRVIQRAWARTMNFEIRHILRGGIFANSRGNKNAAERPTPPAETAPSSWLFSHVHTHTHAHVRTCCLSCVTCSRGQCIHSAMQEEEGTGRRAASRRGRLFCIRVSMYRWFS